jgi:hypothetical protein
VHSRRREARPRAWCARPGLGILIWISIFAIPGQTLEEVVCDVETAASLLPTHISFYQLTLTRGHKLFSSLPDETFQVEGYERESPHWKKRGTSFTKFPILPNRVKSVVTTNSIGREAIF